MPRAPELSGCVLDGRYELHAVIGDGAFGRVYRGTDRRLARTVAVKVIKPWWADDPEWVRRFEREAQLLARVSDPGIVQIFDTGHADEGLYYVAEFVDGESLASRLRGGPLPPREARTVAEQICRALGGAHWQGVVHRDIKPANILISTDGQVKVGDFGLARMAEGTSDGPPGTIAGTPTYMSPEQAQGSPATPASDVYSVGIVLYQMLAGAPPFEGGSPVQLAWRHTHDPLPPLPAGPPPSLAKVVKRALAKQPSHRYADATEMARALAGANVAAPRPRPRPVKVERGGQQPTRVAPRFSTRRNVNPAGRRRTVAAFGLTLTVLLAMVVAAIVLAAPKRVRVPQLHGQTRREILAAVKRLHLHPTFASHYDRAKVGHAIAQQPAAGTMVRSGSTVRVVLSDGPPPVEVPRLLGQSSSSARSILGSLGLGASVRAVPAPGVDAGTVTAQSPQAGKYLPRHGGVTLSVAETPQWRTVTSFSGTDGGASVPFRIRAHQWRVLYRMSYVGTCTLLFICDGPTAHVTTPGVGSDSASFDLNDGDPQTQVFHSSAGVYQIKITPGSDTTRWTMEVQDYY